jgi:hypothetical protein
MLRNLLLTCAILATVATGGQQSFAATYDFDNGDTLFHLNRLDSNPGSEFKTNGPTGQYMRIIHDAVNSNRNRVAFDRTLTGNTNTITGSFDFRLEENTPQPADGFGIVFSNTAHFGTTGPGTGTQSVAERPSFLDSLGIGFDLHPGPGSNDVSIQYNGQHANVNVAGIDLDSGLFHRAIVNADLAAGTVSLDLVNDVHGAANVINVFNNLAVAGLTPYEARVEFAGRSGGLNVSADVDNVALTQTGAGGSASTTASFDHGFQSNQQNSSPGANILGGGPTGNFLRLTNDGVNSQDNAIAFDADSETAEPLGITRIKFDFRGSGSNPADGFSLRLLPTATYGTSGDGPAFTAEEPNIPGVLALGFDFYPNPATNEVSIHFGSQLAQMTLDPNVFDLDSGDFHNAQLDLYEDAGQVYATLSLTKDVNGAAQVFNIFDDFAIAGLSELYNYRLQFNGRTGGANMSIDLDNISAENIVPEPATATLAMLGLGGLMMRRKRTA